MIRQFHNKLVYFGLTALFLFAISSCKKTPTIENGTPVENLIKNLDPAKLSNLILLKSKDPSYNPSGIYDNRFTDTLKKFYIERDGQPVWLGFLKDSIFRSRLNEMLFIAEFHGLQSKFYNGKLILKQLVKFDSLKIMESDNDYNLLSDLDYLLSISLLSLNNDLVLGRINPYKFYKPFYEMPLKRSASYHIFSILQHPFTFKDSIELKMTWSRKYHQLQLANKFCKDFIKTNIILEIDTSQSLESDFNQQVINQRLFLIWSSISDSTFIIKKSIEANPKKYIQKTRSLFGLPNGGLDSIFIQTICGPVTDISDYFLAGLERERWFSKPDTGKFIYVNLTEAIVEMHNDSVITMKVCVGKNKALNYDEKYRAYLKTKNARAKPINSETPVIGSRIKEVVINPTWTVPNSIIGKEMYHQIVGNPNYLTRKGYEVVQDGKVISPNSVNWKKFKPYGVTVKIRQKAGPGNSLGQLKFNFPNGHNIYMHDTPEKAKFGLINRAVSHGCVRLNYPVKMGEFLLTLQNDSLIVDKFRLKLGLQPYDSALQMADSLLKPIKNTEIIRLKNTIPIYLDYKTIVIDKDGNLKFIKDIYRKNRAIAKKLSE